MAPEKVVNIVSKYLHNAKEYGFLFHYFFLMDTLIFNEFLRIWHLWQSSSLRKKFIISLVLTLNDEVTIPILKGNKCTINFLDATSTCQLKNRVDLIQ